MYLVLATDGMDMTDKIEIRVNFDFRFEFGYFDPSE